MIVNLALAAYALYILSVEGFHALALWNGLPVAIGLLMGWELQRRHRTPVAAGAGAGFIAGAVAMSLAGHAAWQLDIWGIATSSSTSGLLFVFLPLYALGMGLASSVLGAVVGLCVGAVKTRRDQDRRWPRPH
jgi:hypothetical protein